MSNNEDSPKATDVEGTKEDFSLANVNLEDERMNHGLKEQFTILTLYCTPQNTQVVVFSRDARLYLVDDSGIIRTM